MSWTAPICENCWPAYVAGQNDDQFVEPTRLLSPSEERCFSCLKLTTSGIYARVNPVMQKSIEEWWHR